MTIQACSNGCARPIPSATLTGGMPCTGFLERLPPCRCCRLPDNSNPHNRAAVCCAALDACCQKAARAYAGDAVDDDDADGTVSYAACRAEKLALLRALGLACDDTPAGGPATVWLTPGEPLPLNLLKAAQVCHVRLQDFRILGF